MNNQGRPEGLVDTGGFSRAVVLRVGLLGMKALKISNHL